MTKKVNSLSINVNGSDFILERDNDYSVDVFTGIVDGCEVRIEEDTFYEDTPYWIGINAPHHKNCLYDMGSSLSDACNRIAKIINDYKAVYDEIISYAEENSYKIRTYTNGGKARTCITINKNLHSYEIILTDDFEGYFTVVLMKDYDIVGDFETFWDAVNEINNKNKLINAA